MSLNEANSGLLEAARAIGCKRWHVVWRVVLPETLSAIVGCLTLTMIAVRSTSAMTGVVGAVGLGDLAIRYGFERREARVMFEVIAILVAFTTLLQWLD